MKRLGVGLLLVVLGSGGMGCASMTPRQQRALSGGAIGAAGGAAVGAIVGGGGPVASANALVTMEDCAMPYRQDGDRLVFDARNPTDPTVTVEPGEPGPGARDPKAAWPPHLHRHR